ncbi:MAG: HAD-IC family P-type ATPase [bacterium]
MELLLSRHWHELPQNELLKLLETNIERGLSEFEVKHRQERVGPNKLTIKKKAGPIKKFLQQFNNPLVYILLSASAVTAVFAEWVDFSVIFGVVFINSIIGFIQESKAEQAIESLNQTVNTLATVIRDNETKKIPSVDIVPGDIILLESGDKVPADLRLVKVRDLKIDESPLTGESLPVEKTSGELPQSTVLADRTNMAYSGTLVSTGRGRGLVVSIGDKTETGRISHLITEATSLATPLTRKITEFSHLLLWVIMGLAGLTFVVGLIRHKPVFEMLMASVALAVATIPEGLPAVVTITLAIGVNRMAKRKAIIRKLPAVETLGSTTVICSDKTGTLTKNQMTVKSIFAGFTGYNVSGDGYDPIGSLTITDTGKPADISENSALQECLLAGYLCNDSKIAQHEGIWKIHGDPTEAALLVSAHKAGIEDTQPNTRLPRIDTIPFESERQYMATLHETKPNQPNIIYVKGSVEKVLLRSTTLLTKDNKVLTLDKEQILHVAEQMALQGLRVLALARKELHHLHTSLDCVEEPGQSPEKMVCADITSDLTFLGLQAMIDPPRPEAMQAIRACFGAGIKVKMITGDHAATAAAIARQLGLQGGEEEVIAATGKELATLSDKELSATANQASVFARVTPEQKLRLVDALQANNHVVAMTGDGVNDAPALKQADIGVAMGIQGTEVAKEAADMILTDDNFATLEAAIEEGRGVFENLTKFIIWTLPTNMGQGLIILTAVLFGTALPISPVQILWINMTTALLLGLMLAFEPKEKGIMQRKPRDPKMTIVTKALLVRIILVATVMVLSGFWQFQQHLASGASLAQAQTGQAPMFLD